MNWVAVIAAICVVTIVTGWVGGFLVPVFRELSRRERERSKPPDVIQLEQVQRDRDQDEHSR